MRGRKTFRQALLALGIMLLLSSALPSARAQDNCKTFGEARQAGWFAGIKLLSAADVIKSVERSTGGKVKSVLVCPGLVYKLTVFKGKGNVITVTKPAQ